MRWLVALPLLLLLAFTAKLPASNLAVLEAMTLFPDQQPYKWEPGTANTGVPADLIHRGVTIIAKSAEGTFCCGYTLIVGHRAGQALGLFEDVTVEQMRQFHRDWYGMDAAPGDPLISTAMTNLGVGGPIAPADAQRGDFLQFWRTANARGNISGHSVVFLHCITDDDGKPIGIHYRSSNASTNGIANATEMFTGHGGSVDPQHLHFARFDVPSE
ncbi:MAG: hypothetical protein AAF656_08415 [Planctomycetota bacterium]